MGRYWIGLRWRSGSRGFALRFLAVLVASALVSLIVVSGAFGSVRVGMKAPRRVAASGLVVLSGRVRGVRNARVEVQRRVGSRWRVVATGMTGGRGVFDLTWVAPVRAGVVRVRVAVLRSGRVKGVSVVRRIKVRARRGPKVVVSPKTQVLAAPTVSSVPKAGKRGVLRFSGGNSVRVGQIVAIGQGKSTPDGFLGRVIAVEQRNGQTVVSTVPATLQQAIPTGSFNETVGHAQAARVQRAAQRAFAHAASSVVSCHGSVGGSVDASLSFGASLELSGSWSVFSGLQSASLTTGAHASASLSATLGGAGSCSLSPHTIARFEGPAAAFLVGPVPVVITSLITVDVDASASAQANVATGITGGFSAQAGIGWHKSGGFYPIEDFTPSFGYTPPTVSSNASVQANVTPKIDVLLYGAAGPQLALKTGLSFNADKNANPWWTLTAPVDVTASLDIPALNLSSPSLHIYRHTFMLTTASGPYGGGGSSSWTIQSTPNPTGTNTSHLEDVSCTSASACTAVGRYTSKSAAYATLAERWNGSSWTIQSTPNPAGAGRSYLNGVSCTSASACTAVGDHYDSATLVDAPLVERWNGSSWSIQTIPNPPGADETFLNGVSCTSATACTAVGSHNSAPGLTTLVERWNGSSWTIQTTPNQAGSNDVELGHVSCTSASACVAVGSYYDSSAGNYRSLVERWNGSRWTIQTTPGPVGTDTSSLSDVSCTSASACTAVGFSVYSATGALATLVERWNGSSWTVQTSPSPGNRSDVQLNGVSCTSASACTAVGFASSSGADITLVERWNGSSWMIQGSPNPTNAVHSELDAASCTSTSACIGVGYYGDEVTGGKEATLAERHP